MRQRERTEGRETPRAARVANFQLPTALPPVAAYHQSTSGRFIDVISLEVQRRERSGERQREEGVRELTLHGAGGAVPFLARSRVNQDSGGYLCPLSD